MSGGAAAQPPVLRIDAFVELICPWCLIGQRHLAQARERLAASDPGVQVQVHWHPVQLVPQVPPGGWPFAEFYLRRLGSPEAVRQRQAQVRAAAARAGVEIDLERIERFPNTARAHRLLALGGAQQSALEPLLERLYAAYFQRGEDIGSTETLLAIAQEQGLDAAAARAWLDDPAAPAPQAPSVPSVPFYMFNGRHALSGAQPPETLWAAMRGALALPVAA